MVEDPEPGVGGGEIAMDSLGEESVGPLLLLSVSGGFGACWLVQ